MHRRTDAETMLFRASPDLLQALRLLRLFSQISCPADRARVIELAQTILRIQQNRTGKPTPVPRR